MKNKGQALVLFVILIPIFLVVTVLLVDYGINSYNEKKFNKVSKEVVEALLDNENLNNIQYDNKEEIIEKLKERAVLLYDANDMETNDLVISIGYGVEITLYNTYEHYSFINSLLGRGNGKRFLAVEINGSIKENEKIIEFKDGSNENN